MTKKYLSWSITATREDGKSDNLTVEFGLDEKLCKAIEDKLDEIALSRPTFKLIRRNCAERMGEK